MYFVIHHFIAHLFRRTTRTAPHVKHTQHTTLRMDHDNKNTKTIGTARLAALSLQRDLDDDFVWIDVMPCVHPAHFGFISSYLQSRKICSVIPQPSFKRDHLNTDRAHRQSTQTHMLQWRARPLTVLYTRVTCLAYSTTPTSLTTCTSKAAVPTPTAKYERG